MADAASLGRRVSGRLVLFGMACRDKGEGDVEAHSHPHGRCRGLCEDGVTDLHFQVVAVIIGPSAGEEDKNEMILSGYSLRHFCLRKNVLVSVPVKWVALW